MKDALLRTALPVLLKTVVPSMLGAVGVLVAALWSDGFRAFCGLS